MLQHFALSTFARNATSIAMMLAEAGLVPNAVEFIVHPSRATLPVISLFRITPA
jgi:hypothetical protein